MRHLSPELVEKLREAIKSGKNCNQVSEEFNISFGTVYRHTKDLNPIKPKKIPAPEIIEQIREDKKTGMSRSQISIKFGVSPYTVEKYTKDLFPVTPKKVVPPETVEKIREAIKTGRSCSQVAEEFGLSCVSVYNYSKDLPKSNPRKLTPETIEKLRDAVRSGKTFLRVSREFGVGFHTVYKYTNDLRTFTYNTGKLTTETVEQLREAVKSGTPRSEVAENFGLWPGTVYRYAKDLPKKEEYANRTTQEQRDRIRSLVEGGMHRKSAARECGVSYTTVLGLTRDLPTEPKGNRSLGRPALEMLKKITGEGYIVAESGEFGQQAHRSTFRMVGRDFPVKMVNYKGFRVIFLEDRKEEALKAFIKRAGRYIEYHNYKAMERMFGLHTDRKKKRELLGKIRESREEYLKQETLRKQRQEGSAAQNSEVIGSLLHYELLHVIGAAEIKKELDRLTGTLRKHVFKDPAIYNHIDTLLMPVDDDTVFLGDPVETERTLRRAGLLTTEDLQLNQPYMDCFRHMAGELNRNGVRTVNVPHWFAASSGTGCLLTYCNNLQEQGSLYVLRRSESEDARIERIGKVLDDRFYRTASKYKNVVYVSGAQRPEAWKTAGLRCLVNVTDRR